ncbi:MAG TPA: pantoate--beta-alanine ligase [Flavipsychrobacter sp.]|nr:pantoate--beta-alanine ligase [Flavipsychrobacter sp.]
MIIFKKTDDLKAFLNEKKSTNDRIGFVPTMGALHNGHLALITLAKQQTGICVCSIFVNPTQFNDKSDFEKYPVTISSDIEMLEAAGCDVLFFPPVEEIYPKGTDAAPTYDFDYLETILEGAHRPGHFKGVGQVVGRLLDIVNPDSLFLGQKDYQQCMVLSRLLDLTNRKDTVELVIAPTVREADGLAMSSRNRRLTEPQRALAGLIYQCLVSIQTKQVSGNFPVVQKECMELLKAKGFEPEYVALANAETLELLENYDEHVPMVALIAAKISTIRLIDNMVLRNT